MVPRITPAGPRAAVAPWPRHVAATCAFAALTWVWLWPLHGRWDHAIPGNGAGDNVIFVWNVWWTRYALVHSLPLLHSPLLLYPLGADLTLHTHTLLPALAVSFVRNPVTGQNILIGAHLFLNFACAYALAWRLTRCWPAALVCGLGFGWSPYVAAHLAGHFNLLAAWVLPLAALATLAVDEHRSASRGACLGAVLAATAYVDYYYLVYACLLVLLLLGAPLAVVRRMENRWTWSSRVAVSLIACAGVAAIIAIGVAVTGGAAVHIGHTPVSMRSAWNPLAAAWLLVLAALAILASGRTRVTIRWQDIKSLTGALAAAITVFLVATVPLAISASRLIRSGGYASQPYLWRSAPPGIDIVTLGGGNPYSALYGAVSSAFDRGAHVDLIESVGWLSPGLLALAVVALYTRREAYRWAAVAAVFGCWALGPLLRAAGHALPFWLPAVVIRWVPVVANARIPARAIVVVYLALPVLAAIGMEQLVRTGRRALAVACAALVVVDLAPAQPVTTALRPPAFVDALVKDGRPGAVLEVPLGTRDGFGEAGVLDPNAMWLQTLHGRAISGGFVARLPRDINDRYRALPIVGSLLRLSSGETLGPDEIAADRARGGSLAAQGFAFVLLNTRLAPTAAQEYVRDVLPLVPVLRDDAYVLYALVQ